jgi:hypothetical protein
MLIGGLWHGAGWTFLLWGALHGLYLVVNHAWQRLVGPRRGLAYGLAAQALTLLAVAAAWVLFRAASLDAAAAVYSAMFGFDGISLPLEFAPAARVLGLQGITFFAENYRTEFYAGLAWIIGGGAIALLLPNSIEVLARYRPACNMEVLDAGRETVAPRIGRPPAFAMNVRLAVAVGALLFLSVKTMNSATVTEFLYFNF